MPQAHIDTAVQEMQGAIDHLEADYGGLQVGRANANLVNDVTIEAYGVTQPLKAVASISVPDAQTIQIQPWDKGVLADIEKGIQNSGLNLNPSNDGAVIRINIQPPTEERRKELVKVVGQKAEEARVSIRHARQKGHEAIRKMKDDKQIGEDEAYTAEENLQSKVDEFNKKVEEVMKKKETEIMTV